jgi:DnaK suppressor protein
MSQPHGFDQIPANAPGNSGPDIEAVGAVIDHFSGKKAAPLPRLHGFEFRALLHAQRRRLLDEMYEIMNPADAKKAIEGPSPPIADDVSDATDVIDAAMMTIIRNNQQLQEIEVALARLSDGTYGICIYCGEGVDRARLKFQPTARYCLPCQLQLISPVTATGK